MLNTSLWLRYAALLIYAIVLVYSYEILSRWWGYFGFTYWLREEYKAYAMCFVATLPALLLPRNIKSFSVFCAYIIFALVFLPCMLVPLMQQSRGEGHAMLLFLTVFISSVVFILTCRIPLKPLPTVRIPAKYFWAGFAGAYVLLTVLVVYQFGGQLRLVGVDDIYVQRFAGGEAAGGRFILYAVAFLSNVFNPFLIVAGLATRRRWLVAVGTLGQILMFATLAARSTVLSPFLIIGAWYLFRRTGTSTGLAVSSALTGAVIILLPFLASYNPVGGGLNLLLTIVYFRTLLISGAAFGVYDSFFSFNPHTYLSHSIMGRYFADYPYGDYSVGEVVGLFLTPTFGRNILEYNANFLATDGIAAFGLLGVPVAALVLAIVLVLLNRAVPRAKTGLASAMAIPFLISISNGSLFASMLTGGGLLLALLIYLSDDALGLDRTIAKGKAEEVEPQ